MGFGAYGSTSFTTWVVHRLTDLERGGRAVHLRLGLEGERKQDSKSRTAMIY